MSGGHPNSRPTLPALAVASLASLGAGVLLGLILNSASGAARDQGPKDALQPKPPKNGQVRGPPAAGMGKAGAKPASARDQCARKDQHNRIDTIRGGAPCEKITASLAASVDREPESNLRQKNQEAAAALKASVEAESTLRHQHQAQLAAAQMEVEALRAMQQQQLGQVVRGASEKLSKIKTAAEAQVMEMAVELARCQEQVQQQQKAALQQRQEAAGKVATLRTQLGHKEAEALQRLDELTKARAEHAEEMVRVLQQVAEAVEATSEASAESVKSVESTRGKAEKRSKKRRPPPLPPIVQADLSIVERNFCQHYGEAAYRQLKVQLDAFIEEQQDQDLTEHQLQIFKQTYVSIYCDKLDKLQAGISISDDDHDDDDKLGQGNITPTHCM